MSDRNLPAEGGSLPSPQPLFSKGDVAFERLFFAHAWEKTALGPFESWPLSLRTSAAMILKLPTPAIIFWGPQHLQVYNAGYAVIMGPRHPRFLGATYADCWPDTYPTIHPWMERVLRGEVLEVINAPFTLTRHGFNEETYFTFSFSPLLDDAGRIGGFLQLVTEKTAEVVAERRVLTLHALAPGEGAARPVAEVLGENPHDIPFSLLYLRSDSAGPLALAGHSGLDAPPQGVPEAVERAFAGNAALPVTPVALLGARHIGLTGDETRAALVLPVRREQSERPRGVIVVGISPRRPLDEPYRAFFEAVAREISASLAARHERLALRTAEREQQNLRDFLMQTPAPLAILVGPEHRFALANQPYLEMVSREVLGRTVRECFEPRTVALFVERLDEVFRTGEAFVGRELPLRLENAPERLLNVSYVPIRSPDGSVKGILAFHYDITPEVNARQRTESLAAELQLAVRARDEFMGLASHELKTPLTSLRLQIQMAQRGIKQADPVKLLKQTNRLARLVDDMLDISRIDAGKLVLDRAPADLSAVAAEVLDRFEPQFAAARVRVTRDLAPGLAGNWDAWRLDQVITNLVTNALRYAPGKGIDVIAARSGATALLTVRDHGPGVRAEDRERIFNRFERATSASEASGLGLGLFISRQIIEAHGGTIRAEPAPGAGAAFVVTLPLT